MVMGQAIKKHWKLELGHYTAMSPSKYIAFSKLSQIDSYNYKERIIYTHSISIVI